MARVLKIERSTQETTGFAEVGELTATGGVRLYPDTVPAVNETYYYRVRFYDTVSLEYSGYTAVASEVVIAAPNDLTAEAQPDNSVLLNWTDFSGGVQQFIIERSMDGGAWSTLTTVGAVQTYTDTATQPEHFYTYRIRGKRKTYTTLHSNEATASPIFGYTFTGVNPIVVPHNTAYSFERTQPFAFETWAYFPTAGDTIKHLFNKYDSATNRGVSIILQTDLLLSVLLRNSVSNQVQWRSAQDETLISGKFSAGHCYHIIVSWGGTTADDMRVMVDGKRVFGALPANNLSATILNTKEMIMGTDATKVATGNHTQLLTRIWNRAISEAEGALLYNDGFPNYNPGMSGVVWENKVNNDTHDGSKFTVLDTSPTGINGTSSLPAAQRVGFRHLDRIRASFRQLMPGSKLYYNTFGNAGMDPVNAVMHSPFTDRARTSMWWDTIRQRTYIGWQSRGRYGWNREPRLMYVDHAARFASPSRGLGYVTPGVIDGHPAPSVCVTPNGQVLAVHEDIHNSPIYIKRTTDADTLASGHVYTEPSLLAYPSFQVFGQDVFIFARNGTSLESDLIMKSSDSGTTWSAPFSVVATATSATPSKDRAYFVPIYSPSKLAYFINVRDDAQGLFTELFYIEANPATYKNWRNKTGALAKTGTGITRAELEQHCVVFGNGTFDCHVKCAVETPNGLHALICNNGTTGFYSFVWWNGTAWQERGLNLPKYTQVGGGNNSSTDYWAIYPYSDARFVIWRIENRGGFDVVVQYETHDAFATIDAGTVISDADQNHEQLQATFNQNGAAYMLIGATHRKADGLNDMFLFEYTPS